MQDIHSYIFLLVFATTSALQFLVQEEVPAGTEVGQIPVQNAGRLVLTSHLDTFRLDPTSGRIFTVRSIDRDKLSRDFFELTIVNEDQSGFPLVVTVRITDINDNAPIFPGKNVSIVFLETDQIGSQVLLDAAIDTDRDQNGLVRNYAIVSGNEAEFFRLALTDNFLHIDNLKVLDRESQNYFGLNISATDSGNPPRTGFFFLNINIGDINDCSPIFDPSEYVVAISENAGLGSVVLKVHATDNDAAGANSRIVYSLSGSPVQFTIDESGVIRTTQKHLECPRSKCQTSECPRTCVLTVEGRDDSGDTHLTGRAYVYITLMDENDHAPELTFRHYPSSAEHATVAEDAANGTVVAVISAQDVDDGLNGKVTMSIAEGNHENLFRLEATSFAITGLSRSRSMPQIAYLKVNGSFNRARMAAYNLTITAVDSGYPSLNSSKCLVVMVNDVNDHTPAFPSAHYVVHINEKSKIGSYVTGDMVATDADGPGGLNGKILYSIVAGNSRGWFTINQDTGLVTTSGLLDRELEANCNLNISATDAAPYPKISYTSLTVIIDDWNDFSPQFTNCPKEIDLPEGVPVGTFVYHFSATDKDIGENGRISYVLSEVGGQQLINGKATAISNSTFMASNERLRKHGILCPSSGELFTLDEITGRLTTRGQLDRESQSRHNLLIIARDNSHPAHLSQSSTCLVTVRLMDVNDNRPIFSSLYRALPSPNKLAAGHQITQVTATDADDETDGLIRYTMLYSSHNGIIVDEFTGAISTASDLIISPGDLVKIQITAIDPRGLAALTPATVLIFSASAADQPQFKFERREYTFTVTENTKAALSDLRLINHSTWTGVQYFVTDGDTGGQFMADAKHGSFRSVTPLDHEEASHYQVSVSAWMSPYFASTVINIFVLDVNDNAPMIVSPAAGPHQMDIPRSWPVGLTILTVIAQDADSGAYGQLAYSLVDSAVVGSNKQAPFTVNRTTGSIYLVNTLNSQSSDIETAKLVVQVTDGGNLSCERALTFRITPAENCLLHFSKSNHQLSVAQNQSINSRLLNLTIHTCQSPVAFAITYGNDGHFGVFPDGQLYLNGSLSHVRARYYQLHVTASDQFHSAATSVTIRITGDDNYHSPIFLQSNYAFVLYENEPIGSVIGRVEASDLDRGLNGQVHYGLAIENAFFAIEPETGIITSKSVFDRESIADVVHVLAVTATDRSFHFGRTSQTAETTVGITILDKNDNWPVFSEQSYQRAVPEGMPCGQNVAQITATDSDFEGNGQVQYRIQCPDCAEVFTVEALTGIIRLNQVLDYETRSRYDLLVLAVDQPADKFSEKTSTAVLTIRVTDINDKVPAFLKESYRVQVREDVPVETMVWQAVALDGDTLDSEISYALIVDDHSEKIFRVNLFGQIYLNYPLDYEKSKMYKLTLKAFERDFPEHHSVTTLLIEVEDVNDNAPIFSDFIQTSIRVPENTPAGSVIATTLAHDEDSAANGEVHYSILYSEPVNGYFKIDAVTGQIATTAALDRELHQSFRLVLQASDQSEDHNNRRSSEKAIAIIIDDVNDNSPVFSNPRSVIVPEFASAGYRLLTVSAVDSDADRNGHVTFDLTRSTDMERFQLDRYDGHVYLRGDVQQIAPYYTLSVAARDQSGDGRQSSTLNVNLVVASTVGAEKSMSFTQNVYEMTALENATVGSELGRVSARLFGKSSIEPFEYFLTGVTDLNGGAVACIFDVDQYSGVLTLKRNLDADQGVTGYVIQIYGGMKRFSNYQVTTSQIRLRVLSVNDQAPIFGSPFYRFKLLAYTTAGSKIGQVAATDLDQTNSVQYRFSEASVSSSVSINPETGELFLKVFPTSTTRLSFGVIADDSVHQTEVICYVDVENPEYLVPHFTQKQYEFTVFTDSLEDGQQIGSVTAFGQAEKYEYFQAGEWFDNTIQVDRRTGAIFVAESRHFKENSEEVKTAVFSIDALAVGHPKSLNSTLVFVTLLHTNSHQQILPAVSVKVSESDHPGHCFASFYSPKLPSFMKCESLPVWSLYGDPYGHFSISHDGLLCIKQALDRETVESHDLTMVLHSGVYRAERRVTVVVGDTNNEAPIFEPVPSKRVMLSSTKVGSEILRVQAADRDLRDGGLVQYKLASSDTEFAIDSLSGIIRLNDATMLGRKEQFILDIVAYDAGHPSLSATVTCTIVVQQENLHVPRFSNSKYAVDVPETVTIGHSVISLSATDSDFGLNGDLTYWIIHGNQQNLFEIEHGTGQIFTAAFLDYESERRFDLRILVEDGGRPSKNDSALVSIYVQNVNDEPAKFPIDTYHVQIVENFYTPPMTRLIQVLADDADVAPFNEIRYRLRTTRAHSMFHVNPVDGWLSLLGPLDREERESFQVEIETHNAGFSGTPAVAVVIITVIDANDNPPMFVGESEFTVPENSKSGIQVAILQAIDPDQNSTLRYSIHSNQSLPFRLGNMTGRLETWTEVENLDRERSASYVFAVEISDGLHRISANLTIHVTDEDDCFPIFTAQSATAIIPDSVKAGHFVYGAFAYDLDKNGNKSVRYRMVETSNDFRISESTGVVTVLRDGLQLLNAVTFDLQATDPNGHVATMTLLVRQASVWLFSRPPAEFAPLSLSEDTAVGLAVGFFEAIDHSPEGRNDTYAIATGNFDSTFSINSITGQFRLVKPLDFEDSPVREIWLQRVRGIYSTATRLTVKLTNVNDNPPMFSQKVYSVDMEEELSSQKIITLQAIDQDGDPVTYSLQNGTAFFELERTTGILRNTAKLDREKMPVIWLAVQATDGHFTSSSTVRLVLRDKNDNPPKFSRQFTAAVPENSPIGYVVVSVSSVDADSPINAQASYSLADESNVLFTMDAVSGVVKVACKIDREEFSEIPLEILVRDGSWQSKSLVMITVIGENDNSPKFALDEYRFFIPSDDNGIEALSGKPGYLAQPSLTFVGQVSAVDLDQDDYPTEIAYSFKQPSEMFSIDRTSGRITIKRPISADFTYTILTVVATEQSVILRSAEVPVYITVLPASSPIPSFVQPLFYAALSVKDLGTGDPVMKVSIRPSAIPPKYAVVTSNATNCFNLDESTGMIRTVPKLTNCTSGNYRIQVVALYTDKLSSSPADVVIQLDEELFPGTMQFSAQMFEISVPESAAAGSVLFTATVENMERYHAGQIVYSIVNSSDVFQIDLTSGAVRLRKQLDYEHLSRHVVTVAARTHLLGSHIKTAFGSYAVSVINENDNPPIFTEDLYTAVVIETDITDDREGKEYGRISQEILTVHAVDPDDSFSSVYYTIEPESTFFQIDSTKGVISTLKDLDYEMANNHTFTVRATDPADPSLFSEVAVTIIIQGRNEYAPVCAPGSFVFSISAHASAGTKIGSVSGTDGDSGLDGVIEYFLVGNAHNFVINQTTGQLTVVRDLSVQSPTEQHVHVLLRNFGTVDQHKSSLCDVVIHVMDGKNTPYFVQKDHFFRVREDAEIDTKLGVVSAMTELQSMLRFALISGDDKGQFGIDTRTGEIKTVRRLDREVTSSYALEVMASVTDAGKDLTSTATIHISVDDVNDNAPFFDPPVPVGHLKENINYEIAVLKLNASDHDLSPAMFTYRLVGSEWKDHFKIHPSSGVVTAIKSLDRETTPEVLLKVTVSDSGFPSQTATLAMKIVVDDVNDNPSLERPLTIVAYVDEFSTGLNSRRRIGNVRPTDPDGSGDYRCRIVGDPDRVFFIDKGCDLVATEMRPGELYRLNVEGSDGKHEPVQYEVVIKAELVTKLHYDNSITVRLAGISPELFLERHYVQFMQVAFSLFHNYGQASVFGLTALDSDCLLQIAVGKNTTFLAAEKVIRLLQDSLSEIQTKSGLKVSDTNYKPCKTSSLCPVTADCEDLIQAVPHQTSITTSQSLVIMGPLFEYSHRCVCAAQFSGPECQLLCPADYCQNGGTCAENGKCLCSPGFHGSQCQFDLNECNLWGLPNCYNGGKCVNTVGSFRCQCATGFSGRLCQEERTCTGSECQNAGESFGFSNGASLELKPWKSGSNEVSLVMSTKQTKAVLLFTQGPIRNGMAHFISLEIKRGFLYFSFGSNARDTTRIMVNKDVSDGRWYKVEIARKDAMGSISVAECNDESCDTCQTGDERCSTVAIGIVKKQFFGNNSIYIGGVPSEQHADDIRLSSRNFLGCMKNLIVNGAAVKLSDARSAPLVTEGQCSVTDVITDICQSNPCSTSEMCVRSRDGQYRCVLPVPASQTFLTVALVVVTCTVIVLLGVIVWRYRTAANKKKAAYSRPPFLSPVSLFEQGYLPNHYNPQRESGNGSTFRRPINENFYKENSCIYHASQHDAPYYYCVLESSLRGPQAVHRGMPGTTRPISHYASASIYESRNIYTNDESTRRKGRTSILLTSPADGSEGKESSASTQPVDILSLNSMDSGRYDQLQTLPPVTAGRYSGDDRSDDCSDCDNCKKRRFHNEMNWSDMSRYGEQPTYAEVTEILGPRHVLV